MKINHKIELGKDIWGAPEGVISLALARAVHHGAQLVYVARDDARLASMQGLVMALAPSTRILQLPAWDCLPYDRLSPQGGLVGRRVDALAQLAAGGGDDGVLVMTTVNAWLQRVPPRSYFADSSLVVRPGALRHAGQGGPGALTAFLAQHAYLRTDTVRETGEFAVRGGIFDVFPPGLDAPVRLDFFGDEVETIRWFDAATQRTTGPCDQLVLRPVAEFAIEPETIARFRTGYLAQFGATASRDALYESVSEGRTHPGMEHWLPLFHDHMERVADYCADWTVMLDHEADAAMTARWDQIEDFYQARSGHGDDDPASPYRPLPVERLYLTRDEGNHVLAAGKVGRFYAFAPVDTAPDADPSRFDAGGRPVPRLAGADSGSMIADLVSRLDEEAKANRRPVVLACSSRGAASRLTDLFAALDNAPHPSQITDLTAATRGGLYLMQWPLDAGFETDQLLVFA
ncbi:MAG: transcription-repair coupling factor, partial [Candidatus Puniceispirillum sp.]